MQKLLQVALCPLVSIAMLAITGICLGNHAKAAGQQGISDTPITVNFQNRFLRDALDEIRKKSGLGIIYNDGDLPEDLRVSYSAQHTPVKDVLEQLLKNTKLTFKEYKGNLVIYIREQLPEKRSNTMGSLEGSLFDGETGEPLIGATVLLIGTALGGSTNAEGRYAVTNVPEGVYNLGVSYIGYETAIVRDVRILPGQITTIDHRLKIAATQLQDIEIIGDKALSGNVVHTNEVSMVNEIKTSSLIITGISAQQIARSVDQDAGQVARRLPGVAVLNNFVNIRGMHERYNLTYLNGMVAPSSETDTRAFSYDLLPSGMIDKMTVYRSPAPELLADWAGGVIKIETKNTSIARQLEVNFSTWYRSGSSFKDYNTYEGGKRDWLGTDDGTRALPDGFPTQGEIPAGGFQNVDPGTGERTETAFTAEQLAQNAALGRSLYNKWNLKNASHGPDYRAGINYYDAVKLGKMRLSNLTSLSTTQAMQIVHQNFAPQAEGFDRTQTFRGGRDFKDTISQKQARWSAIQNLRLDINARHHFEIKGLYNQLGTDETLVRDGHVGFGSDFELGYQTRILYTYRSRAVLATQLAGSHSMGKNDQHAVQWGAGYGYSKDDTPAQRMLYLTPLSEAENASAMRYLGTTSDPYFSLGATHYYTKASEKNRTVFLDYTYKLPEGIHFKAGVFNEYKHREQDARMIGFGGLVRMDADGNYLSRFNAEEMYNPNRFAADGSGTFIYDNSYLTGQFEVESSLLGVYGAVNISLFNKKLNIYGGVRYEGQDLLLTVPPTAYVAGRTLTDRYLYYWLPSANLSWNFTENFLLRAAYGKTLNRPNFREMMPYLVNDPNLERVMRGDSSLVDAEIHNFDLRWEYYPGDGEFVSLGAYYKNLANAIEPYIRREGNSELVNFSNTPRAEVFGLEAEVRKSLSFLPWRWVRSFSVIGNVALLRSEVAFKDSLFSLYNEDFRVFSRPLQGTASYVVNVGLYYDHEDWGTRISALYNVLGQRLILAPTGAFPAYYEMPRHVVDLTLRQRVNKHIELRAGVQDVLNQAVRRYADYDRNEHWSRHERSKWPYKDWMFQKFRPGSYYTVGLNLTF